MARNRKQRRQQHGSAWHWKQTDAWYYTEPGTKKRVPLFDEKGERIRGKENKEAACTALARIKVADELSTPKARLRHVLFSDGVPRIQAGDGEQVKIRFRPANSIATFEVAEEFMTVRIVAGTDGAMIHPVQVPVLQHGQITEFARSLHDNLTRHRRLLVQPRSVDRINPSRIDGKFQTQSHVKRSIDGLIFTARGLPANNRGNHDQHRDCQACMSC